jgi:hypothetical protein
MNGHQEVIAEAKRRFQRYFDCGDKGAIPPSLRSAIFGITIHSAGAQSEDEYRAVLEEWKTTTSVDGKDIALRALGRTQNPKLLAEYLKFISEEVSVGDIHTGAAALAANPKARYALWKFFQDNFDHFYDRLAGNMVIFGKLAWVLIIYRLGFAPTISYLLPRCHDLLNTASQQIHPEFRAFADSEYRSICPT